MSKRKKGRNKRLFPKSHASDYINVTRAPNPFKMEEYHQSVQTVAGRKNDVFPLLDNTFMRTVPTTKGKYGKYVFFENESATSLKEDHGVLCVCDHCVFSSERGNRETEKEYERRREDARTPRTVTKEKLFRLRQGTRSQGLDEYLPGAVIFNSPKQGRKAQLYFSGMFYIIREETDEYIRTSVPYEGAERARARYSSNSVTWDPDHWENK